MRGLEMKYKLIAAVMVTIFCLGTALAGLGGTEGKGLSASLAGGQAPNLTALEGTTASAVTESAPPQSEQQKLLSYDEGGLQKETVYYDGGFLGWTSFSGTFSKGSPMLWISTSQGWSWYASMPLNGWTQMLLYVSSRGTVNLYEVYPSGHVQRTSLGFGKPGWSYVWFYGDIPGRHVDLFTVDGVPSNAVMIDVSSAPSPPPVPPGALRVGETFTKDLSANPASTGYHWVADYDAGVIRLVDQQFEPGSGTGSIGAESIGVGLIGAEVES
jgi:hypothetical protein